MAWWKWKKEARRLRRELDRLNAFVQAHMEKTCNNCIVRNCPYAPEWGQPVRWNCPHYKGRDKL